MQSAIEQVVQVLSLTLARVRALVLRLRGADIGSKTSVGSYCQFLNPQSMKLGSRVTLERNVFIKIVSEDAKCSVGDFVFVGKGTEFDVLHEITIGSHVLIAPDVFITDHNHQTEPTQRIDQQPCIANPVVIHDDVWIGTKVTILPGVTIGRGAVVGAGSVVVNDIAEMTIVAGVPARPISKR